MLGIFSLQGLDSRVEERVSLSTMKLQLNSVVLGIEGPDSVSCPLVTKTAASHQPGKRRRSIASPCRPHHLVEQLQSYRDGCCAQRHPVVTVEHRSRTMRGDQPSGGAATSLPCLCDGPPVRDVTHMSARVRILKAHPRDIYIKVDEVCRFPFVLVIFISSSRAKHLSLFSRLSLEALLPELSQSFYPTFVQQQWPRW
jgi:hypothetical protein